MKILKSFDFLNNENNLENVLNLLLNGQRYIRIDDTTNLGNSHGIYRLELSLDGHNGNYVCLDSIRMKNKGNGDGTNLMNLICNWADENNIVLTLTPSDIYGASSVERLKRFYKNFGFVNNKGRYTDYNTKQSMYRLPN